MNWLPEIPFLDARAGGLPGVVSERRDAAKALIGGCCETFGAFSRLASRVALPLGDAISRRWLKRSGNPYLEEIETFERMLTIDGVVTLNLSYEWGCTSLALPTDDSVRLSRTLDWPFPGLGEGLICVRQQGPAGEFVNLTWPSLSGVFTAMAPGRFAASLNQAPMRLHGLGLPLDWLANRFKAHASRALPPAHLLRRVFEQAGEYEQAKRMLTETPVCVPVIYCLSGVRPDQGCVIERLETEAEVRELGPDGKGVSVSNHFQSRFNGLGRGFAPRAWRSDLRAEAASRMCGLDTDFDLAWNRPPLANPITRLAMTADARIGRMSAVGMDGERPVTRRLDVTLSPEEACGSSR